ncbi:hypothetical protein IT157_00475 [bacterium]|nr:hypothetical protein [bacterium]
MTDETFTQFSRREIRRRARTWYPWLVRSMATRTLLFVAVLIIVGVTAKPWHWEWLRPDESAKIAEDFLFEQGVELGNYTLIQAAEYRHDGVWNARRDSVGFSYTPAIGYVNRYFHTREKEDSWTVEVSPAGRIFKITRDVDEFEPGRKLQKSEAYLLVLGRLASGLGLGADRLELVKDSLSELPQRNDWFYQFRDLQGSPQCERYFVRLTGDLLTSFEALPAPTASRIDARPGTSHERLLAFALIVFGVFQIILHHRHPISWKRGMWWGLVAMLLVSVERALTISQATLLVPGGSEAEDFVRRVLLAALIDAVQSGVVVTLIIASGESIARDLLPNITTFTRIAPSHRGWRGAWVQSARWALPAAAMFLAVEAVFGLLHEPGGLSGDCLKIVAEIIGSPVREAAGPVLLCRAVLWDEAIYRLWLFPLLIFWVRGPLTAMLLMAGAATYFAGFHPGDWLSAGAAQYVAWSLMAGWLMIRVGILGAMLFHGAVLCGMTALALIWTGFGAMSGIILLVLLIFAMGYVAVTGETKGVKDDEDA